MRDDYTVEAPFDILLTRVRVAQKVQPESVDWFIEDQAPPLHPNPPSLVIKLGWRHTGRLRKRDNLLTGEGVGEEPNRTTRERLVLYKSFNTLWLYPSPRLWSRGEGKLPQWALIKSHHIAKTLYRKIRNKHSQKWNWVCIRVSVSNLYIPMIFWERGRTVSILGIQKSDLVCSAPKASQQLSALPFS